MQKMNDLKIIEAISRAIIIRDEEILLCKASGKNHYFFPGGHIEFGETATQALEREIFEESGAIAKIISLIGISENEYSEKKGNLKQEVSMIFETSLDDYNITQKEKHISLEWKKIDQIKAVTIYPIGLKKSVIEWLKDKRTFWSID